LNVGTVSVASCCWSSASNVSRRLFVAVCPAPTPTVPESVAQLAGETGSRLQPNAPG
jgi:hypothetical protein